MLRLIARAFVRVNPHWAEQLIGRLLVETFRARMAGTTLEDVHEARHLTAALAAGNSDPCVNDVCHLDKATMQRLHDANWPDSPVVGDWLVGS